MHCPIARIDRHGNPRANAGSGAGARSLHRRRIGLRLCSEADVAQITAFVFGDADELKEKIAAAVASGDCRMFVPGERVFVTSVAAGAARAAVRLPGDTVSYWMPASWSRPTAECAAYTTRRSQREKLGLAATTQANPPEPGPAETLSRQPPPPLKPVPTACAIKPVMTDAEIALCRKLNRRG